MNKEKLQAKQQVMDEVSQLFKSSKSFTVVEYRGLTVKQTEELRKLLRKDGADLKVFKNTLVAKTLNGLGVKDLDEAISGPNAYVFSNQDGIAGPRILVKFAKDNEKLLVKGGYMDGKVLSKEELSIIATLPSREGLLSMLASVLNAPLVKFAMTVKAIADAKEKQTA
jgi:large subunit ribosomal protein L10